MISLIAVSFASIVLTPLRHLTSGAKRGSKGGGKFWLFFILQVQEGTGQPSFLWPPAQAEKTAAAAPGAPTPCTGRDNIRAFPCFEAWASVPACPLSLGQEGNPKHQDTMRPWGGSVCVGVDISNPCERPAKSIFLCKCAFIGATTGSF